MKITVRLYSTLREILPPEQRGVAQVDLPDNSNLQDLLTELGIQPKVTCSINGQVEPNLSQFLHEGDEVRIFRPSVGGDDGIKAI